MKARRRPRPSRTPRIPLRRRRPNPVSATMNETGVVCESLSIDFGQCGGLGECTGVLSTLVDASQTVGACDCQPGYRGAVDFLSRQDTICDTYEPAVQFLWGLVLLAALGLIFQMSGKVSFLCYVLAARAGPAFGFRMASTKDRCIDYTCWRRPGQRCSFGLVRLAPVAGAATTRPSHARHESRLGPAR